MKHWLGHLAELGQSVIDICQRVGHLSHENSRFFNKSNSKSSSLSNSVGRALTQLAGGPRFIVFLKTASRVYKDK